MKRRREEVEMFWRSEGGVKARYYEKESGRVLSLGVAGCSFSMEGKRAPNIVESLHDEGPLSCLISPLLEPISPVGIHETSRIAASRAVSTHDLNDLVAKIEETRLTERMRAA